MRGRKFAALVGVWDGVWGYGFFGFCFLSYDSVLAVVVSAHPIHPFRGDRGAVTDRHSHARESVPGWAHACMCVRV